MEDIELEESLQGNDPRIWPQYRHISDQRIQSFRFSIAILGVLSGALTWLLLQDAGPWICTPLALLTSILAIALFGFDRQLAAQVRYLQSPMRRQEGEASARVTSENGRVDDARVASEIQRSGKRNAWPIYCAYAALAILGLFYAALPIWGRSLLTKTRSQTSRVEDDSFGRFGPNQRVPFIQPANLPPGAQPPFGNPRSFTGTPANQIQPFARPPVGTPPARQVPFASPAAGTATPPSGVFPPNTFTPRPFPARPPITPPPNPGAPQ